MSGEAFLSGLRASSLSGAVIILTVALLRPLFQDRTPRAALCALWDVALVRLLIWGEWTSPVSIWRWLPGGLSAPASGAGAAAPVPPVPLDGAVFEGGAAAPGNGMSLAETLLDRGTAWLLVWLAVALALAGRFLWSHLHSRRVYGAALPCEDARIRTWLASRRLRRPLRVRTCDRITAPLTYGILRPVILLPSGLGDLDRAALSCVLEHEYAHIRRFDTLRKALLAAALCIHWFNPAAWALYVLSNRELELACDEAVTERGAGPAQYARTLLDLEERRGQWGLSGSHFSQNALEERIKTMMKEKHRSLAAVAALAAVLGLAVTVFASAAPEDGKQTPSAYTLSNQHQAVEGDVMILAQGGGDGEKLYSVDGGKTWLTEERYQAEYGEWCNGWQVEWWTAEDYAQWLEEEKVALRSIIGDRGYTSSEGWFTWDQKRVDEAIALYESILEDIKNGALYSKSITDKNGKVVEDVALGSDGPLTSTMITTYDAAGGDRDTANEWPVDPAALLEELEPFGLSGDETRLTYNGKRVRCLVDGVDLGDQEYAVNYVYYDQAGEVDLHTLREATPYGDGSYDPMGKLTGLTSRGTRGFDQGLIDCAMYDGRVEAVTVAEDTSAELEKYASFGLRYEYTADHQLRMYWNGKAVHSLYDTETGTWFANSLVGAYLGEGALDLETVYENGKLRGLRESDPEAFRSQSATAVSNGDRRTGRTFEEIFAPYAAYGLAYTPRASAMGSLTWNGEAVRSFADLKPDGGTFSYEDPYVREGLTVRTQYDEAGKLTGLTAE